MFKREGDNQPTQYLARHIVIATTVDTPHGDAWELKQSPNIINKNLPDFQMVVDLHAGKTPLTGTVHCHQSYASNAREGAI